MIIVSITGPTMREALVQLSRSAPYADMFELRLDLIRGFSIPVLLIASSKPTVFTCRPKWEGGAFAGEESGRVAILKHALRLGASFVDIELNAGKRVIEELRRSATPGKLIVSNHLTRDLPNVKLVYQKLTQSEADVIKLAFEMRDSSDLNLIAQFLNLAKKDHRKAIAVGMGESGEASRVLYKKWGGWATYAAAETGEPAATGQIRASELLKVYDAKTNRRSTKIFGVIGKPVRQSKGVYVHNPLFRRAGLNAVYCRFPVTDLKRFMKNVAPMLGGFSITIPHKQEVMKFLDSVDKTTESIGAVNTVLRRGRRLVGTNTDAPGALDAIERVVRVKGKRMLVLGAGGAARAIAHEARRRGAEILVFNRTHRKAVSLARSLGGVARNLVTLQSGDYDIIVNATSVGMTPAIKNTPLPKRLLKGKVVFDAVYNPPVTLLLREAKRVGAKTIGGAEMYVHQAARQSELYTGVKPSIGTVRQLLVSS